MKFEASFLKKEEWIRFSQDARLCVFDEIIDADQERLDFALIIADADTNKPIQYACFTEGDKYTLYLSYGGTFPPYRNTIYSFKAFLHMLEYLKKRGYTDLNFHTRNDNVSMLKFAMKTNFKIVGIKMIGTKIFLEHNKNLQGE